MSFQKFYEEYKEEIEFIHIYIREAHPTDGWWLGRRLTRGIMRRFAPKVNMTLSDPVTLEERQEAARMCHQVLFDGPLTLVDDMDDYVNRTYAGWPVRQYLIDLDGKIIYADGMGPYGFKPAKMKKAIEEYLRKHPQHP